MPAGDPHQIVALLAESLAVWRLRGEATWDGEAIVVSAAGRIARITAAPPALPFRWMVAGPEKTRGAGSISALLRAVRTTLDPDHEASRLRLAPQGVVPP